MPPRRVADPDPAVDDDRFVRPAEISRRAFVEWHLHVEIDGGQHIDVAAWWADMRRQNDMWISGDRVLRFPAWAIRNHQDEVIAQVRAALTAAGWDGRRKDLGN